MTASDAITLAKLGAIVLAVAYVARKASGLKLGQYVPQVVADGLDATGQLAGEGYQIVAHPLDAFGISSGTYSDGTPHYSTTAPWAATTGAAPDDIVSNGAGGMNFNYF